MVWLPAGESTFLDDCDLSEHQIPQTVLELAEISFMSCVDFRAFLDEVSEKYSFPVYGGAFNITLRELKVDNTIERLKVELLGDQYDLSKCVMPSFIIDVGANVGGFCVCAAKMFPQSQVLCAEPAPLIHLLLVWNLAENDIPLVGLKSFGQKNWPGVVPLQAAFAATDGWLDFAFKPFASQESFLMQLSPMSREGRDPWWYHAEASLVKYITDGERDLRYYFDEMQVKAFDLRKLLGDLNVTFVDMLKLDCEGCEFGLIASMRDWVSDKSRIRALAGEIHWFFLYPDPNAAAGATVKPDMPLSDIMKFKKAMELRGTPVDVVDGFIALHLGINVDYSNAHLGHFPARGSCR